ncbi:MAG TPA: hypothetical protein VLH60_04210 [Sedimentisphaerales bacterium]|nr:hypothetical protein [Sedimentisphaerales bacterium]
MTTAQPYTCAPEHARLGPVNSAAAERVKIDDLRQRLTLLRGIDRAIAEMYLENGASIRRIARLARMNEVTVARRIARIFARLHAWASISPQIRAGMNPMEERIAREYLVRGRSQRAAAARLGCTRYAVRKTLRAVNAAVPARIRTVRKNRCTAED